MLARGLDTRHFADIMQKMTQFSDTDDVSETQSAATDDDAETSIFEYFSSHPATQERIERFREAAR
jgi:Zn-dependent protease with chaperone function